MIQNDLLGYYILARTGNPTKIALKSASRKPECIIDVSLSPNGIKTL
jgi:hypothetical protein